MSQELTNYLLDKIPGASLEDVNQYRIETSLQAVPISVVAEARDIASGQTPLGRAVIDFFEKIQDTLGMAKPEVLAQAKKWLDSIAVSGAASEELEKERVFFFDFVGKQVDRILTSDPLVKDVYNLVDSWSDQILPLYVDVISKKHGIEGMPKQTT